MPDMSTDTRLKARVGALDFSTPVIGASGTFGNGVEYADFLDPACIGGFVTKSVTARATKGNPPPRIAETPAGMLNAIGLQNEGVEYFIRELLPPLESWPCRVIVNVAGHAEADYAEVVERLDGERRIDAMEINVSCPNVKHGGMAFGVDPCVCGTLVADLRRRTSKPMWVKLSPNVSDIASVAKAAEASGADALTVCNTLLGMAVDIDRRRPILANVTGGLSGPAIHPVALRLVWQVSRAVRIPVVGAGGVASGRDAAAMMLCGASAVQVGTANFITPAALMDVARELDGWLERQRDTAVGIVGTLQA